MRISTALSMLAVALSVLVLAKPASAQGTQVDFSGGYQYFRFVGYYDDRLPAGWATSVAVGKERVKFVVDFSGSHGDPYTYTTHDMYGRHEVSVDAAQVNTFQGGVEFSGPRNRVVPFARLLTGAAIIKTSGTTTVWVFTPEAGLKIRATEHIGAQVAVGFPLMANADGSAGSVRFFAGIVIRK